MRKTKKSLKSASVILMTIFFTFITFSIYNFINPSKVLADTAQSGYLTPEWWGGNVTSCDPAHHGGSTSVGLWYGISSCYPRPGNDIQVSFTRGGSTVGAPQLEWECVEMVERYMTLAWGITPYGAYGAQIVSAWNNSIPGVTPIDVSGGNPSHYVPSVGDILSFGTRGSAGGHTDIVTSVRATGGSGNYAFTVFNQNFNSNYIYDSSNVWMSNWNMQTNSNFYAPVNGWLHQNNYSLSGYISGILPNNGSKQLFVVDLNGQVATNWQQSGGWAGWHEINNGTTTFPLTGHVTVTTNQAGELEAFATDVNGKFWHMWGQGGSWSGWNSLDGTGSSDMTVADYDNSNDMVLWITGTDGHPYYRYSSGGSWTSWIVYSNASFPLGTRYILGKDPSSVNAIALGGDGKLYALATPWGSGNGWGSSFGIFQDNSNGNTVSEVTSFKRDSSGNEEVVAPKSNGTVWHNVESNGVFQGWAQISSSPQIKNKVAGAMTPGTSELYARDVNYGVEHNWNTGCINCYSGWNNFSASIPFSSDPSVVSSSYPNPEVYVTATDGKIYHQYLYQSGGNNYWSGWQIL